MIFAIIISVVVVLIVTCCVVAMCRRVAKAREDPDEDIDERPAPIATSGKRAANKGTIVKLTMIFLQILGSMSEVLSLDFPPPFSDILVYMSYPTLSISVGSFPTVGCHASLQPTFYGMLIFFTVAPLLFMAIRSVRFVWHFCEHRTAGRLRFELQNLFSEYIFVMFIVQPTASRYAFQTFSCTDRMDDGKRWLLADLTLECDTPDHIAMCSFAVLMIFVWPIGVSIFFYLMLRQNVDRIKGTHGDRSRLKSENVGLAVEALSLQINNYLKFNGSLDEFFSRYDRDKKGSLSKGDFIKALAESGCPQEYWFDNANLDCLYSALCSNESRGIRLDDLIQYIEFESDVDPSLDGVSVLASGYKPTLWFWELVVCFNRLTLTGGLVLLARGSAFQTFCGMIVSFFMTLIQSHTQPFDSIDENRMSNVTNYQVLTCMSVAFLIKLDASFTEGMKGQVVGMSLAVTTIGVVVYATGVTSKLAYNELKEMGYLGGSSESGSDDNSTSSRHSHRSRRDDDGASSRYNHRSHRGDDGASSRYNHRSNRDDDGTSSRYNHRSHRDDDDTSSRYNRRSHRRDDDTSSRYSRRTRVRRSD
jgi:hypothetical protein